MGLLQNGNWVESWYDTKKTKGVFVCKPSSFRNQITTVGSPGPSGVGGFKAEKNRYHLYVSLACPWAHRALEYTKQILSEKNFKLETVICEGSGHSMNELSLQSAIRFICGRFK